MRTQSILAIFLATCFAAFGANAMQMLDRGASLTLAAGSATAISGLDFVRMSALSRDTVNVPIVGVAASAAMFGGAALNFGSGDLQLSLAAPKVVAMSRAFGVPPSDLQGLVTGPPAIAPPAAVVAPTPEPSTWMMLLVGLAAAGLGRRGILRRASMTKVR